MASLRFTVQIPTRLAIFWRRHLARGRRTAEVRAQPRSVIVFRLDQLGDLVLTTPLFRELRRNFPGSRCTVVVQAAFQSILATNRNVDEILPLQEVRAKWLPARARRLASALWFYWTELRHRHFDLAISPRWDVDENLATMLCVLSNAGTRVGHSEHGLDAKQRFNRGFVGAFDFVVPLRPTQHEVDRNLETVEALGGKVEDRRLEICLTANDRKFARELLIHRERDRLLAAIGIGGRAPSRRWPLKNYSRLIAELNRHHMVQPVIVCSNDEHIAASELSTMLPVPPCIVRGIPLRVVCAVLEECDIFVGNDSGPAHLAAAMDCPTLVVSRHPLHGDPNHPNSPARFAPRCSRYRVVQPSIGAGDCATSCRVTEPHCINVVTVEVVLQAAMDLLRERPCISITNKLPQPNIAPAEPYLFDEASVREAARVP
jgi:ADP-heptose:LPS heptosyltransferase